MTFILISGKPGVGKTAVCNRLHGMLDQNGTFKLRYRQPSKVACREDHITHYEKKEKNIVVSTASDGDSCMVEFAKYLDSLAKMPDIIVTTIRENDDVKAAEYPMSRMLALLDAIADGTKNLENHYNQNIAGKLPADLAPMPMRLSHNAFVLHLEKQNIGDVDNEIKVLKTFWDDNADKIKYAIDFALARL